MTRFESLQNLRNKITVPQTDFVEITDNMLRFTYLIDGNEKHILLSSREEVAEWLLAHSFISRYCVTKQGIALYEEQLTDVPRHGEHFQSMVEVPMTWDEFADRVDYEEYFTRDLVKQLAASHEYNYYAHSIMDDFNAIPSLIKNFLLTNNRA